MRTTNSTCSLLAIFLACAVLAEAQERDGDQVRLAFIRPKDTLTAKVGDRLNAEVEVTVGDTKDFPPNVLFVLSEAGTKSKNRIWDRLPKLKAGSTPTKRTYMLEAPLTDRPGKFELKAMALMGEEKDPATGKMVNKTIESDVVRVIIQK